MPSSSFNLTRKPISLSSLLAEVEHPDAGAVLLFAGTVREWTHGKRTLYLTYEAYEPMALKELERIGAGLAAQWPDVRLSIMHRLGDLQIGEVSVAIAVSAPHRPTAYAASRYAIEELKRTVPIWKKEYGENGESWIEGCHIHETAWMEADAHGPDEHVHWKDEERYARQLRFSPIGEQGQRDLAAGRVAIVGVGALGSAAANHLVRAGVGFLRLIDRDVVDISNLQRQTLFQERDARLALPKVLAAKEALQRIQSHVNIEAVATDLTGTNAEDLLADVDVIIDGTDNFSTRYLINEVSVKRNVPWIYGGIVADTGATCTFLGTEGPCFACLHPEPPPPGQMATCDTAGIIGPIVQIIASLQVVEAMKLLTGHQANLRRTLLHVELWSFAQREMSLPNRLPACPVCAEKSFPFLEGRDGESAVLLCGRDTVQIRPKEQKSIDLIQLAEQLSPLGKVRLSAAFLRFEKSPYQLSIFPDGRVLVHGTSETSTARSLYAQYLG